MRTESKASPQQIPATLEAKLAASPSDSVADSSSEVRGFTRAELWVHRLLVLAFVFLCAVVGVLLVIMPWRPEWTDNHLLMGSPGLQALVANDFVRGLCSGLGILDIWIGFWEAVHYREEQRP